MPVTGTTAARLIRRTYQFGALLIINLSEYWKRSAVAHSSYGACTKLHSAGFSFANHSDSISPIIPCPLCGHSPNSSITNSRRCLRCPSLVTGCCFSHYSSGLCLTLRSRTQACAECGKPHHTPETASQVCAASSKRSSTVRAPSHDSYSPQYMCTPF